MKEIEVDRDHLKEENKKLENVIAELLKVGRCKEKLDKKDVYHLKVTSKEGTAVDEYLDAQTYLVNKVKVDFNGQAGEIEMSDYKEVDGVKFPNTMDITNAQMGTMSFITNKVLINPQVDASVFKKPVK